MEMRCDFLAALQAPTPPRHVRAGVWLQGFKTCLVQLGFSDRRTNQSVRRAVAAAAGLASPDVLQAWRADFVTFIAPTPPRLRGPWERLYRFKTNGTHLRQGVHSGYGS